METRCDFPLHWTYQQWQECKYIGASFALPAGNKHVSPLSKDIHEKKVRWEQFGTRLRHVGLRSIPDIHRKMLNRPLRCPRLSVDTSPWIKLSPLQCLITEYFFRAEAIILTRSDKEIHWHSCHSWQPACVCVSKHNAKDMYGSYQTTHCLYY